MRWSITFKLVCEAYKARDVFQVTLRKIPELQKMAVKYEECDTAKSLHTFHINMLQSQWHCLGQDILLLV